MKKTILTLSLLISSFFLFSQNTNPSLSQALNSDGTLNMNAPDGSYDVSGFRFVSQPGEAPKFLPADKGSKAAGDEFWTDPFTPSVGVDNTVRAICYYSGTAYIGGEFISAAGLPVNYIASWNGISFSQLGSGLAGAVYCIEATSGKIFVGGGFLNAGGNANADRIAAFNTSTQTWEALGTGANNIVYTIKINGTDVYVGGAFTQAGGVTNTGSFARWNTGTSTWYSMGTSLNAPVYAIAISSPNIYIGGNFTNAAGIADADYIAKWNGTAWSALSSSLLTGTVKCIQPDASGNLYVGGFFANAGGLTNADCIVKYTTSTSLWSALGTGAGGEVRDLSLDGTTLYVAGNFGSAGGLANTTGIAKYNTSTGIWSPVESGLEVGGNLNAVEKTGADILIGGYFPSISGITYNHIAQHVPGGWQELGSAFNGSVNAICVNGPDVYFGGGFTRVAGYKANYFVRWNMLSGNWTVFDSLNSSVSAIVFDSLGNLFIAGSFTDASGDPNADRIARWDNPSQNWVALGTGIPIGNVYSLVSKGSSVYAGGWFSDAGGIANADFVAKWNGTTWSAMGPTPLGTYISDMYQYNGKVYVCGFFMDACGVAGTNSLAAWNTSTNQWESVGGGMDMGYARDVYADSTGVYVAGDASLKTSPQIDYVAKYDGSTWTQIGSGIDDFVEGITKRGDDLYITGQFFSAGSGSANMVAHYDGVNWRNMGSGITQRAMAMVVDDSVIYIGGGFHYAGGKTIEYASRYQVLPYITTQSNSQSVCAGSSVPLSVTAHGTATLQYQWYYNGTAIPGATSSTYTIAAAGVANAGNYKCTVKNDGGSITSSTIIISLLPVLNAGPFSPPSYDACEGEIFQLSITASGAGTLTYQWLFNGSTIAGATNSTYSLSAITTANSGNYSCNVTDACTTIVVGPASLSVHTPPNIGAIASHPLICPGSASTLTASGGSTYIWTPSTGLSSTTSNPVIASPPASITYTVSGTDSYGCANTTSVSVIVKTPVQEQLCIVTQDTSISKCIVVWEKTPNAGIKEYKVLRESTTINVYNLLATVPYDSLSAFVDTSSHPESYSHRYRIIAVDTCGNDSDTSAFHRTMHLNVNYTGTPGSYNLIWDAYQGFSFPTYEIYRGTTPSNLSLIWTLPSSTPSYTDNGAPTSGDIYYWVKIVKNDSCVATSASKASSTTYTTSVSNMEQYKIIGIDEREGALPLTIYPNPFGSETTLQFDNPTNSAYTLQITDVAGRTVFRKTDLNGSKYIINREGLRAGYYMVELRGEKLYRGRIIIH